MPFLFHSYSTVTVSPYCIRATTLNYSKNIDNSPLYVNWNPNSLLCSSMSFVIPSLNLSKTIPGTLTLATDLAPPPGLCISRPLKDYFSCPVAFALAFPSELEALLRLFPSHDSVGSSNFTDFTKLPLANYQASRLSFFRNMLTLNLIFKIIRLLSVFSPPSPTM